jgi:CheY-like chemotaxis protein
VGTNELILIAEHNEADVIFYGRALEKAGFPKFKFVPHGDEVITYLAGTGEYADRNKHPFPGMLILDYTLPRKSAADLLKWMCDHPDHRVVPTVIFSSNLRPQIIAETYGLGVHTFFRKPSDTGEMGDLLIDAVKYWRHAARPIHDR